MRLKFDDNLIRSHRFDPELCKLADRHYSRGKVGSPQFTPPGAQIVLRDFSGLVVFVWLWQQIRDDNQAGYNCSIFRNETERLSSDITTEAEAIAFQEWGPSRLFTYVDPKSVACPNAGGCFKHAGWSNVRTQNGTPHKSTKGYFLLHKYPELAV